MRLPVLALLLAPAALAQALPVDPPLGTGHLLTLTDAGFPADGQLPFALDEALTDWSFGQLQSSFPTEVLCQRQTDAVPRSANLGSIAPNVYLALAFGGPDGATAYRLAVNNAGPPVNPVLELAKARCGDASATPLPSVTAGPGTALGDVLPAFLGQAVGARGPGGRVCWVFRERSGSDLLGCLTPDEAPVGVERWLTAAQLDASLTPDGGFQAAFPALVDYTRVGWTLRSPVFVPDGRVFALATLTYARTGSPGVTWARQWVVTQASAAAPPLARTRAMDVSQSAGQTLPLRADLESPGFKAQKLFHHPPTGTVLAWPASGLDLLAELKAPGFPLLAGLGFGVLDVASAGSGHLDLTWEVARHGLDPRVHPTQQTALCQVAGGQLLCGFVEVSGGTTVPHWKVVHLDRAGADFDRDGLTGAQEALAGTSDFAADSDGDGATDGEEVEVAHSDPRDAGSGGTAGPVRGWGYSTLLQDRLPLRTVDPNPFPSRVLCGQGRCVKPSGQVAFVRSDGGAPLFADPTGTVFAWKDAAGVWRQRLDGGAELVLSLAQLTAAAGLGTDRLAVATDGRIVPLGAPVPVVLEGGQVRTLWSPNAACEPAWNECLDGGRPFDAVLGTRVLAWDVDRGRLLVAFQSQLDQRVLAVPLDGGARSVLVRGDRLPESTVSETIGGQVSLYHSAALPGALTLLGAGGAFGSWNIGAGLLSASAGPVAPLDRGSLATPHGAGWAGAAVTNDPFDTDALDGVNELSPMSTALEPGDLLTWWGGVTQAGSPDAVPVHLAKVGRRGGLHRFHPGLSGFQAPSALARAPGGALCAVARETVGGPPALFELLEPGPGGVPTRRVKHPVSGAVDCAYAPDGTLHVLAAGPPRLSQVVSGAEVRTLSLPAGGTPQRLAPAPGGGWYVASADGPLRCVDAPLATATSSSLWLLAVAPSRTGALWAVAAGGRLLRLNPEGLCSPTPGVADTGASLSALESARLGVAITALGASLAERADGRVVLQGTRWSDPHGQVPGSLLYFYNPETGRTGYLNADDLFPGLAQVPDAGWCDPWGEGLSEAEQTCLTLPAGVPARPSEPADASVPAGPDAGPADGGVTPPPGPGACGCSGAPVEGLLGLALLAAWRRRRRG